MYLRGTKMVERGSLKSAKNVTYLASTYLLIEFYLCTTTTLYYTILSFVNVSPLFTHVTRDFFAHNIEIKRYKDMR
jgi:hypothetical protein